MAELTVELRHLLKSDFELFDFDYQFDDLKFKKEIEQAVIDYYYTSEIGQEVPDLFKHKFKTRWKRIIPYYNKLHNTTLLTYNPLVNYTINEALNQLAESKNNQENTAKSLTKGKASTTSNTNEVGSDYPQQPIIGSDYRAQEKTLASEGTTTTEDNGESESEIVSRGTTKSNYEKTIEGLTGVSYQSLVRQERENLTRIIDQIIEEMKPSFYLIY